VLTPRRLATLVAAAVAVPALLASPAATAAPAGDGDGSSGPAGGPPPYRLVWDDFSDGFAAGGPGDPWFTVAVGPYAADDGVATATPQGLHVRSSGTNPATGEPAIVRTLGQDPGNGLGLPGTFDHLKWVAFTSHTASSGFPGFDAVPGQVLSCGARMSGRTYGTGGHPFGSAVADPDADPRLALVALNAVDPETNLVLDFVLTNERIYAMYERRPDSRPQLGNYASFAHIVPLARRSPGDWHDLEIAYDRSRGAVHWLIDGRRAFTVDEIGHRLSRDTLAIDHGGVDMTIEPRQLNCGMGMFAVLDGARPRAGAGLGSGSGPAGDGLVRLTQDVDSPYFRPSAGEPAPQRFADDASLPSSRLFGQGASLDIGPYVVASTRRR
jgi:hypothetical protein